MNRKLIEFMYKGTRRRVEPYLLGLNAGEVLTLSAWQLSGGSAVDWRDFRVDLLTGLQVTTESFDGKRHGYNSNDPSMHSVRCKV